MDKLSQFDYLDQYFRIIGKLCGLNLIDKNWKIGIIFIIDLCTPVVGTTFYIYNLKKFWEDFEYVCYSSIIFAPLVGGVFRLLYWPFKHSLIVKLYNDYLEFSTRFEKQTRQGRVVQKYVIVLNTFILLLIAMFMFTGIGIAIAPIIVSIIFDAPKILPLPLYIAGLDFESHPGFELNYLWQLGAIYLTINGFSMIQGLTLLFIGASTMQIEVLRTKVQELEHTILLELNDNDVTLKRKFTGIIDLHNEIIKYADDVEIMLSFQYFLDVTTLTILVVIALFYARIANWLPGYGIAGVVLVGAFINYALGELNCIQLEKLNEAIYNIPWYQMSIKMQKMHLFLLQKSLDQTFFTCGGLKPINVDLFASFCNSVYSYLLILKNLEAKLIP